MDLKALSKIGCGLYVLTARENDFDNGCIINTVMQVASNPNRISIAVNKTNKTHDMIAATGIFNVSFLTESVSFDTIKAFGFESGRNVDKLKGFSAVRRDKNGLVFLTESSNAYISARVISSVDLGSHTLFIADISDCEVLSSEPGVTYEYYHEHIKPKPTVEKSSEVYYRCRICGYIYRGDELPADFICPLCKHPSSDFERIEADKD